MKNENVARKGSFGEMREMGIDSVSRIGFKREAEKMARMADRTRDKKDRTQNTKKKNNKGSKPRRENLQALYEEEMSEYEAIQADLVRSRMNEDSEKFAKISAAELAAEKTTYAIN